MLKVLLYAVLLMPLGIWSIFLFPFITTKILYFRLLIEAVLVLYVVLALKHPEIRPRWNWLLRAVWIYVAVLLVTSIFGVDFGNSFLGTIERGEGIVTLIHFAVYLTILVGVLRTWADWQKYLLFTVSVFGYVAAYSFLQLACFDTPPHDKFNFCDLFLQTTGTRVSGTVGNASFFAAFLIFGLFLSAYLFVQRNRQKVSFFSWEYLIGIGGVTVMQFISMWTNARTLILPAERARWIFIIFFLNLIIALVVFVLNFKFKKYFLAGIFVLQLAILYNTQTRGGLLAAGIAFLIYLFFNIFKSESGRVKAVSAALLVVLIGGGILVYANRDAGWVQKNDTLKRLATISPTDITTQSRLDTWAASWEGAKHRIVTGYGYENYNIAFNKYFPARIFKDQGSQIWFDRAHNIFFDVLVVSGALGLVSYFGIFALAFWVIFRLLRKKSADYSWQEPVILGVLLIAYVIQNLFVFDTQATYLMFFLVFAHIAALEKMHLASPTAATVQKSYPPGFFMPITLTVLVFLAAYFVNIEPALANFSATEGIKAARLHKYRDVKGIFEKSLSYGTYMDIEIRQRLVDYTNEALASNQLTPIEQDQLRNYVIAEMKKSIASAPRDVKNYLYLMSFLNRTSASPATTAEIYRLGEKAVSLSPTRPQIYTEFGQAAFAAKEFDRGLGYFQKAVDLNPEPKESHFNMLLAAIIAKRDDLSLREITLLRDQLKYVFSADDYVAISRAYLQAGDRQKSIEALLAASLLAPDNTDIYIRLAATYGEMCDLVNAKKAVEKLVEINPNYDLQGQQFLQEQETKCSGG